MEREMFRECCDKSYVNESIQRIIQLEWREC